MTGKVKAAAIQMQAVMGNVAANLDKADRLVDEAAVKGAGLIILPEFFTSAACFHPSLLDASVPLKGPVMDFLVSKAQKHQACVGGSFIAAREGERYNTFVLAMPDGTTELHDKDQPTMWENCYYVGGNDDGILHTPWGPAGAVLCWEFVRNRTASRLLGKVDLVIGGSCWWTVPQNWVPKWFWDWHDRKNAHLMAVTPATMARILGVPVVHAAHAGDFRAHTPWLPGVPFDSFYLGETQIIDGAGVILARMTRADGEGVITAEIAPGRLAPRHAYATAFWIPRLPVLFRLIWAYQNLHGSLYYQRLKRSGRIPLP